MQTPFTLILDFFSNLNRVSTERDHVSAGQLSKNTWIKPMQLKRGNSWKNVIRLFCCYSLFLFACFKMRRFLKKYPFIKFNYILSAKRFNKIICLPSDVPVHSEVNNPRTDAAKMALEVKRSN